MICLDVAPSGPADAAGEARAGVDCLPLSYKTADIGTGSRLGA